MQMKKSRRNRQLEMAVCADDIIHWLTEWGWTYDPRELRDPVLPFTPFPRQVEFLHWLREREEAQEDGLVEKSRDMGLTFLCCAYALHGWLFREGYSVGFGSRKLDLVDKISDPSSIFEKIRFMLGRLPDWMLPAGFRWDEHDCHAKLINPANGSTITGEGGDQIGRGGRVSIYFVDEAAFLEHPASVERSLSQTTRCRIDVSTPNGPGNPFYQKRYGGQVKVFRFHWTHDPRKGVEWYEAQKKRFDPVTVAQEIDIDFSASVEGITIPAAWVRAAVDLQLPDVLDARGNKKPYQPEAPSVCGLDVAEEGKAQNVLIHRIGSYVKQVQQWAQTNTTDTAHRAAGYAEAFGASTLNYDCVGVGAGVRGTLDSSTRRFSFTPNAINSGDRPSFTRWPDGRSSQDRFLNLRAEMWWLLRVRFEKAYEFRELNIAHPPEDMISIPNHAQLIADLSLPLHFYAENGKIKIEAKDAMRKRGVKSPDHGDALALSFAPVYGFDAPPPPERRDDGPRSPFHGRPQRSAAEERGTFGLGGRGPGGFGRTVFHGR
jgi:phage terminase large subunit